MKNQYSLFIVLILAICSCNRYSGVDNIKAAFEENKADLEFLKESAKDSSNIAYSIYRTFDKDININPQNNSFIIPENIDSFCKTNSVLNKQVDIFKKLNLKAIFITKYRAKISFNNTGECLYLIGLDSIDYNEFNTRVRINRYKNGEKTGWIIPLDAHWYIYTDCD
jgi:hypothetical protein